MKIRVFISTDCPECQPAAELAKTLKDRGYPVEIHDMSTPDGLNEAEDHGIETWPSILIESQGEILSSREDQMELEIEHLVREAGLSGSCVFVE